MSRPRRSSAPDNSFPKSGTVLEVCAVSARSMDRPLGGPMLRAVGLALVNPNRTITAWLEATPVSGTLLLRPCPPQALLTLDPQLEAGDFADTCVAAEAQAARAQNQPATTTPAPAAGP